MSLHERSVFLRSGQRTPPCVSKPATPRSPRPHSPAAHQCLSCEGRRKQQAAHPCLSESRNRHPPQFQISRAAQRTSVALVRDVPRPVAAGWPINPVYYIHLNLFLHDLLPTH